MFARRYCLWCGNSLDTTPGSKDQQTGTCSDRCETRYNAAGAPITAAADSQDDDDDGEDDDDDWPGAGEEDSWLERWLDGPLPSPSWLNDDDDD